MFKITCKVKRGVRLFVYTVSHKQKMTLKQECDKVMIKIIYGHLLIVTRSN